MEGFPASQEKNGQLWSFAIYSGNTGPVYGEITNPEVRIPPQLQHRCCWCRLINCGRKQAQKWANHKTQVLLNRLLRRLNYDRGTGSSVKSRQNSRSRDSKESADDIFGSCLAEISRLWSVCPRSIFHPGDKTQSNWHDHDSRPPPHELQKLYNSRYYGPTEFL